MDTLLIPYRRSNLWGYCTTDKTIVIPCQYDWAGAFYGDAAIVGHNGKYGAINRSGALFVPFIYDSLCRANQEIYMYEDELLCIDSDEEMEGTDGIPPEEGQIRSWAGVDFKFSNGKYQAVDKRISAETYELLGDLWDGLIWVCKDNKWGAINPSGKQIIPCMYEEIAPFDEDHPEYTFALFKGRWGIIDHDNVWYWED